MQLESYALSEKNVGVFSGAWLNYVLVDGKQEAHPEGASYLEWRNVFGAFACR
jgi:hypothetical protein